MEQTTFYCDRSWHRNQQEPADYILRTIQGTTLYACCAKHLERAVKMTSTPIVVHKVYQRSIVE